MNKKEFIKSSKGQWEHPGKKTLIPNAKGRITMKGVNYPVLGIDDQGNRQLMLPQQEYQFPGNSVYEIPLAQDGMAGMMKARMAYSNEFGNPSGQRMVDAFPPTYTFNGTEDPGRVFAGDEGTHYMTSIDNYAVPYIQQGDNKLFFNSEASPDDKEAIRFDSDQDAEYFSKHYKEIAPMSRNMNNKQMGGQQEQEQLMAMVQAYAEANQIDPQEIMQQLQQADPETQQQILQQMAQELQGQQAPVFQSGMEQPMPEQNPYAEEEMMQEGGPSKGGQANTYMNKTNNFVNWLKNSSQKANAQNMMNEMHQMPDGSMMPNSFMQPGGTNKSNKNIISLSTNYNAPNQNAYTKPDQQFKNLVNQFGYDKAVQLAKQYGANRGIVPTIQNIQYASKYNNKPVVNNDTESEVIPDVVVDNGKRTGTGTGTSTNTSTQNNVIPAMYTVTGNTTDNTNPAYQGNVQDTESGWNTYDGSSTTNTQNTAGQDEWKTKYEQLASQIYGQKGNTNRNYNYGYGAPNFNMYENPFMGLMGLVGSGINGLSNLFAGMGQGRNQGFANREQGLKGSPNTITDTKKSKWNEPHTTKLKWPKQQKERDAFDKHVGNDKDVRSDYATYRDTDEQQNALKNTIVKENAIKNLGKFKNRPQKIGGLIKAQDGIAFNPWASQEIINGIQSLTSFANQAEQRGKDSKQRQELSDITNKQSDTSEINRGDWFGSSGLAYGALRPDQDIYSGPNAFAKNGGTWFNNNFFQNGGGNEEAEMYEDNEYNEGDELYMTDEEIQAFIDQGGTLDFVD